MIKYVNKKCMNKLHTSSRVKAPKSVPYSTEISPEAPAPLDRYIYLAVRADIVFKLFFFFVPVTDQNGFNYFSFFGSKKNFLKKNSILISISKK